MPNATIATKCAIAGGGPAGMMLGYLLARAGVDVAVLEKHVYARYLDNVQNSFAVRREGE